MRSPWPPPCPSFSSDGPTGLGQLQAVDREVLRGSGLVPALQLLGCADRGLELLTGNLRGAGQ